MTKEPLQPKKKVQIPIKLSESQAGQPNKVTCSKELEIVLKKLKKGKAPGLDRISNEMSKISFVFS